MSDGFKADDGEEVLGLAVLLRGAIGQAFEKRRDKGFNTYSGVMRDVIDAGLSRLSAARPSRGMYGRA